VRGDRPRVRAGEHLLHHDRPLPAGPAAAATRGGRPVRAAHPPDDPGHHTLLLRRRSNGEATLFLHWRDPGNVATAGGLYDAIPAGEFQPSSIIGPTAGANFDLWRNIVRELNEELLGAPEFDGSAGQPLDYDRWPCTARCRTPTVPPAACGTINAGGVVDGTTSAPTCIPAP